MVMKYTVSVERLWGCKNPNIRVDWCTENIGKRSELWDIEVDFDSPITYTFRYEKDALMFTLRWTGSNSKNIK